MFTSSRDIVYARLLLNFKQWYARPRVNNVRREYTNILPCEFYPRSNKRQTIINSLFINFIIRLLPREFSNSTHRQSPIFSHVGIISLRAQLPAGAGKFFQMRCAGVRACAFRVDLRQNFRDGAYRGGGRGERGGAIFPLRGEAESRIGTFPLRSGTSDFRFVHTACSDFEHRPLRKSWLAP